MRKITTLILLFTLSITSAQIQKLKEFSSGNFIGSRIIYENNNEDVYGYFLLYEFDKKSREVYELEYVVLDKNLNKLTSGIFTQGVYKSILGSARVKLTFVKKIEDELFFGIHDFDFASLSMKGATSHLFNQRFRKINLNTFTISNEFVLVNDEVFEKEYKEGDILRWDDLRNNQTLFPTKHNHFVLFGDADYRLPIAMVGDVTKYIDRVKTNEKRIYVFDKNMKKVWSKEINTDQKNSGLFYYRNSDDNTLIFQKKITEKKSDEIYTFEIYDINTGRFIAEVTENDPNYRLHIEDCYLMENELIFYFYLHELKDKKLDPEKTLGYVKIVFDKTTGKEKSRDYLLWDDLKPHIDFKDKFGNIQKYGRIIVQNFINLPNGNTIAIAEGYKSQKNSEILDLYIMELDPNMKVTYFKKVDKIKTSLKDVNLNGRQLLYTNFFDFYYCQKLDDDGNYVILYSNNERDGSRNARRKNPLWSLGIVTYVEGEFHYDKLQLTTNDGTIYPTKAKNGYILLQEHSESNGYELRMERINY